MPNKWAANLKDAVVPDPVACPTNLPDISPEDSISQAGKARRPPVFRAEDMADPTCWRDYGRAGIAHRRTDPQARVPTPESRPLIQPRPPRIARDPGPRRNPNGIWNHLEDCIASRGDPDP